MLIRDDWAAIHYRVVEENLFTGEKIPMTEWNSYTFVMKTGNWSSLRLL
ncbi:MAG: hypothetical protein Q4D12_02180 [Bacteroidales bacterium]|nr:hypothetical protein [Bacteroidales bacterium]